MLYIVLILVLAALGLLVTALITATSLWAWVSIVLSVLAGVFLVADWVRRRSSRTRRAKADAADETADSEPAETAETTEPGADDAGEAAAAKAEEAPAARESGDPERTELIGAIGQLDEDQPSAVETGDPAEEATSAADAKAVAKLKAEVLVVDEYPRYHVASCRWLAGRETIPISVAEARDLGFTPCARCTPDAKLLAAATR